jgi:hypothetical protein
MRRDRGPGHQASAALDASLRPRLFYSLGAASYLDAPAQDDICVRAARWTDAVLLRAFRDVYRSVSGFLEALFGEDVELDADRAVPGFHIFEYRGVDRGRTTRRLAPTLTCNGSTPIPAGPPRARSPLRC